MPVSIVDSVVGAGGEAIAGSRLVVDYVGTYVDATTAQVVTFDQSHSRPSPFSFQLGAGQVISGWDQGLLGMKVGGVRQLVISSDLAYGAAGSGTIPPNTELTFQVHLHAVETFPAALYYRLTTVQADSIFARVYGSRVASVGSQGVDPFADAISPDPVVTNYWIESFAGGDVVSGGQFSDVIFAGEGSDSVDGGAGNDALIGGAGDDYLDGGAGDRDVAVYHGVFADYQFSVLPTQAGQPAQFTVSDLVVGRDGVDRLQAVERLVFADRLVTAAVVDGGVHVQDVGVVAPQSTPLPVSGAAAAGTAAAPASVGAPSSVVPDATASSTPVPAGGRTAEEQPASALAGDVVIAPLLYAHQGAGLVEATQAPDRIIFVGVGAEFGRGRADVVSGFDSQMDRLVLAGSDFRGQKQISFVAVEGKKQLRLAALSQASVVYRENSGDLFWNQNGSRSGWGEPGGCFARLDRGLSLSPMNFAFG